VSPRLNRGFRWVNRKDEVMWSWIIPMIGPPNRGERMCSWTCMMTFASARASWLWSTCRFISSPSKSALYGVQSHRLNRKVLCGRIRTKCAIMLIRWSEGCRLNRTMSPSMSWRSTTQPGLTMVAHISAFFSITLMRCPSSRTR